MLSSKLIIGALTPLSVTHLMCYLTNILFEKGLKYSKVSIFPLKKIYNNAYRLLLNINVEKHDKVISLNFVYLDFVSTV